MSGLDDREHAFEKKFVQDQELQFKVHARRDKLFGLWVAGKLGKSGAEAEEYARSVVLSDLQQPGDDDVLSKVAGDMEQSAITINRSQLLAELERSLAEAKRQVMGEE